MHILSTHTKVQFLCYAAKRINQLSSSVFSVSPRIFSNVVQCIVFVNEGWCDFCIH